MPFPITGIPTAAIACVLGILIYKLLPHSQMRGTTKVTHTRFAIAEIVDAIDRLDEEALPMSHEALAEFMSNEEIDWNGCSLEGSTLHDAWGNPIQIECDQALKVWSFRSSGSDRAMNTGDDLIAASRPRQQHRVP